MSDKKEYIDREALFKALERACWFNNADRDEIAEELLLQMPTADVEEVRHGKWIEGKRIGLNVLQYTCSECGLWADAKFPYCHCGAKMDGKGEG